MAQVSMTVRLDSKLKAAFDDLCAQFGMSANTAMNIFVNAVVRGRRIPFEIKAQEQESVDARMAFYKLREESERNFQSEMSVAEIDEEIYKARSERK